VASDDWESAVQVVFDLIRSMPAALVALGAVLVFPYFLPQPKTNLHELAEQLPLAVALMRVPRGEAAGDRHDKRMSSWESAPVTLRDLTQGLPAAPRGRDTTPLVLQYLRDHNDAKLGPIVQRVDVVELPRLRTHLADPERQGGRDRRKEMWRIGTAMESAALLMQRARGRQVPVSAETQKRAQEYVQARLPDAAPTGPRSTDSPDLPVPAVDPTNPAQHPPWLQRPATAGPPPRPAAPEVVPVSVSEDPSLLPPAARPATPSPPPSGAPPTVAPPPSPPPAAPAPPPSSTPSLAATPVAARPAAPTIGLKELAALKQSLGQELLRLVDERMALLTAKAARPPTGLDATAVQQVDERLNAQRDQLLVELTRQLTQLQERLGRDQAALEMRQRDLLGALAAQALDRRWAEQVDPRLADGQRRLDAASQEAIDGARSAAATEIGRLTEETRSRVGAIEEALQGSLGAQLDLHLREAAEREQEMRAALRAEAMQAIDARFRELEAERARGMKELEQRVSLLLDGRLRDVQEKLLPQARADLDQLRKETDRRFTETAGRLTEAAERARTEAQDAQVRAMADLQVRLQAYTDQKLREDVERERQKYIELLARLKGEVDASLTRLIDSPRFDATIREKTQRALDTQRVELERLIDARVGGAEAAGRVELSGTVERIRQLEAGLDERRADLLALEESVRSELDDLDRRAQILADRLVPVVRKTWQRISDLEKGGAGAERGRDLDSLDQELRHEVRRLETALDERVTELRDRMETSISNQGRVWLTLVRQLSQLTEDRRALEESRGVAHRSRTPDDRTDDEATNLEALPSLLQPRGRSAEPDDEDDEPSGRGRRRRRSLSRT
jgi:hypothetical protein